MAPESEGLPVLPLYRVAHAALAVGAIRLAAGGLGFGAALLAGAGARPAGAALAFGFGASVVALVANQRWAFYDPPPIAELPSVADRDGAFGSAVRRALMPSTVGVAALLAVSLPFEAILSAVLAGILAGMSAVGLASCVDVALWERHERLRLYADLTQPPQRFGAAR